MSNRRVRKKKKKPLFPIKILLGSAFFVIVIVAMVWIGSLQQPSEQMNQPSPSNAAYPTIVNGVFYNSSTITEGTTVSLPKDFVDKNRLVFIDVELSSPMKELICHGQNFTLSQYRSGKFVPLMVFSTPFGRTIACVRACIGGSFSFYIYDAKYLVCDCTCGTKWDIETLRGVTGTWAGYPPPQLPSVITDKIEIDLADIIYVS